MLLAQMEDNLISTNTPNEKGTPQSRTYTVNDIAAILGIGRATAYKLVLTPERSRRSASAT